jgi:hypothetical protein
VVLIVKVPADEGIRLRNRPYENECAIVGTFWTRRPEHRLPLAIRGCVSKSLYNQK